MAQPKFVIIVRDNRVAAVYSLTDNLREDVPYLIIDEDEIGPSPDSPADWSLEQEVRDKLQQDPNPFLHYIDGAVEHVETLYPI